MTYVPATYFSDDFDARVYVNGDPLRPEDIEIVEAFNLEDGEPIPTERIPVDELDIEWHNGFNEIEY